MKLIAGLLAASHAEKLRFGANQCTFGPAHWCQDIVTASNCGKGAITYCSQNEWNKDTAPTESCESCKTAIGLVNMYLTDNKTREDVKEVLDYACFKCPEQEACKKMIDNETDKVFDFIQSIVDPETVCTGLRICSTDVDESFYKAIEMNIEDMPSAFVKVEEPELPPMPIDLDAKLSAESPSKTLKANLGNTGCDICKLAVIKIDEALEDKETDGEVMDYAEEACDLLPAYSDQCKAAIEMYGPQMIKMVEDNLKPNVICASVGLCNKSGDWRLPESCAQPSLPGFCRALMPSYFFNTDSGMCEKFNYGGCGGNSNRFETLKQCEDRCENALGMGVCEDCKLAIAYVKAYIEDKGNQEDIEQALEHICDSVPDSFKMECQDIVDVYGPQILQFADGVLDPNFICEKAQLCTTSSLRTPLGIDECTLGPKMWCSSVEMAKKCKAYQYCKDKGLLPQF